VTGGGDSRKGKKARTNPSTAFREGERDAPLRYSCGFALSRSGPDRGVKEGGKVGGGGGESGDRGFGFEREEASYLMQKKKHKSSFISSCKRRRNRNTLS